MLLSLSTGNEFSCVIFSSSWSSDDFFVHSFSRSHFASSTIFWFNSIWLDVVAKSEQQKQKTTPEKNRRKQIEYATREKYTYAHTNTPIELLPKNLLKLLEILLKSECFTYARSFSSEFNEKKANKMAKVCLF